MAGSASAHARTARPRATKRSPRVGRCLGQGGVDGVPEGVVAVDEEQREQLVAAATYRYTADDTTPRSRATARSDSAAAPSVARCSRPIRTISAIVCVRARSRGVGVTAPS